MVIRSINFQNENLTNEYRSGDFWFMKNDFICSLDRFKKFFASMDDDIEKFLNCKLVRIKKINLKSYSEKFFIT